MECYENYPRSLVVFNLLFGLAGFAVGLPLIPIVGAIAVILLGGFSWTLVGWMVIFIVLNGVQFAVLRPKGCTHCRKRYICPGSAAR